MKFKILAIFVFFLMLFFVTGCETLEKIMPIETPIEEPKVEEEMPEEPKEEVQLSEEPATEPEPEGPAEIPVETPEEIKVSETTTVTVTPQTVKPIDIITIKVTPNKKYGYKTMIKIYDVNKEIEEKVKQVYIKGCGSICKKEKSTTFKAEYDWEGIYCARVVDVETNEEAGDCFKVE